MPSSSGGTRIAGLLALVTLAHAWASPSAVAPPSGLEASRSMAAPRAGDEAQVGAAKARAALASVSDGRGGRLELLGPQGPIVPGPFEVALVPRPTPDARGLQGASLETMDAEVLPGPPRSAALVFEVRPKPGVRRLTLRARAKGWPPLEAQLEVGPPATQVALTLDPPLPTKGRDTGAELTVRLLREDGRPDTGAEAPVIRVNVGSVEGLERAGPGVWKARYVLPEARYPEVAILVAFAPWPHAASVHGAIGHLLVPLASAVTLPGRSEPGAALTLEIAGERFGPERVDGMGRFRIPVVVPPGHSHAVGHVVDRAGNRSRTRFDLRVPPTDRLACVHNPPRLPADGESQARILCAVSDPQGRRQVSRGVRLRADRGALSVPRETPDGLLEWIYTSPADPGSAVKLEASWGSGRARSREAMSVALTQGPAASLTASVPRRMVHRNGELPVRVEVRDGAGRPRPGARLRGQARLGVVERDDAGRLRYRPPERLPELEEDLPPGAERAGGPSGAPDARTAPTEAGDGAPPGVMPETVWVEAYGPLGTLPARVWLWSEPGTSNTEERDPAARWFVAVTDPAGAPVPEQPMRVGGLALTTGPDGRMEIPPVVEESLLVEHRELEGLARRFHLLPDGTLFPSGGSPFPPRVALELLLAPPVPVDVRLEVDGPWVVYWAEDARGEPLPSRPLELSVKGLEVLETVHVEGRTRVRVAGKGTVRVIDSQSGVVAVGRVGS